MGKVYKNQSFLNLTLNLGVDLTGAQVTQIKYQKPSGSTGSYNAEVTDETAGKIKYKFLSGDLNESGQWAFWGYIVFSSGDTAAGEPAFVNVYDQGS